MGCTDPTSLGYHVREAVEHDLTQMNLGVTALPPTTSPEHAMPRLRYDEFGKILVVENLSDTVRADQLTLEIPEGAYLIEYDVLFAQSPGKVKVTLKWLENGEPQSDTQTVYF